LRAVTLWGRVRKPRCTRLCPDTARSERTATCVSSRRTRRRSRRTRVSAPDATARRTALFMSPVLPGGAHSGSSDVGRRIWAAGLDAESSANREATTGRRVRGIEQGPQARQQARQPFGYRSVASDQSVRGRGVASTSGCHLAVPARCARVGGDGHSLTVPRTSLEPRSPASRPAAPTGGNGAWTPHVAVKGSTPERHRPGSVGAGSIRSPDTLVLVDAADVVRTS